jgi:hypothetical protein
MKAAVLAVLALILAPGAAQIVEDLHVDFPEGVVEEHTSYTELPGAFGVSVHIYGASADTDLSDFEAEWEELMAGLHRFDRKPFSFDQAELDLRLLGYENYSIEELAVLVGVAWGYNATESGMVYLDDGTIFDLSEVIG